MKSLLKWWKARSTREQTYILIALGIAVVYVVSSYIVDPFYSNFHSLKKELKNQEELLDRYDRLISNASKAQEKMMKIQGMKSSVDSILLDSNTPDLANAELQGLLKNHAKKTDISFTRISPKKSTEMDDFVEIRINLPFRGNIQQIQNLLYEIDTAEKIISTKQLTIKRMRRRSSELRVDMEAAGYIRKPRQSATDKEVTDESL